MNNAWMLRSLNVGRVRVGKLQIWSLYRNKYIPVQFVQNHSIDIGLLGLQISLVYSLSGFHVYIYYFLRVIFTYTEKEARTLLHSRATKTHTGVLSSHLFSILQSTDTHPLHPIKRKMCHKWTDFGLLAKSVGLPEM